MGNQRTLFSVVNKALHKSQTVLPNNINSDKDMTHSFNNFFCQKYQIYIIGSISAPYYRVLQIHDGYI